MRNWGERTGPRPPPNPAFLEVMIPPVQPGGEGVIIDGWLITGPDTHHDDVEASTRRHPVGGGMSEKCQEGRWEVG